MAVRQAQVTIVIDDKSLVELNAEIKILETSIKNLKIGTTEWVAQNQKLGTLKDRFKQATDEAKKLQGVVQKVTGADMVRSVAKLGAGMVGAFSAASGSLKLLGINSEAFDEMTAKATTLMSVMGGLNQISELFSTTNLKGLKSIGAGFSGLVTTIKGASTAMKAALISTGIGALVVGLGLVISNWDKIKNAISGTSKKEQEAFDTSQKSREETIKSLEDENKVLQERQRIFEESIKYLDTERAKRASNSAAVKEDIFKQNQLLDEQITKNTEIISQNKKKLEKSNFEELLRNVYDLETKLSDLQNNRSEVGIMEYGRIEKQLNKSKEKLKIEKDANNLLIQQNVTLELQNQNYNSQKSLNESILDVNALAAEETKNSVRDIKDLQASYEAQLVILNTQKDKENEIYQLQKNSLELQRDELNLIPNLTIEQKYQLQLIESKLEALKNENIEFNKQHNLLKDRNILELDNLMYQRELDKTIHDSIILYEDIKNNIEAYSNELNNAGVLLEDQVKNAVALQTSFDKLQKIEVEREKSIKLGWSIEKGYVQEKTKELELFIQIQEATKKKLENDREILVNNNANLNMTIKQKENDIELAQNQLYRNSILLDQVETELKLAKTAEEKNTAESKMNTLLSERYKLEEDIANLEKGITDDKDAQIKNNIKIDQTEKSINKTVTDTSEKTKEISDEVEKQVKIYKRLQNFVGKYNEEIQAGLRAVTSSMEVVASLFERQAANRQDEIDRLNIEYDNMMRLESDRQDRLLKYEEELKDAGGDRFDELLRLIDQEKKAKNSVFLDEKAHKNEIAKLEHQRLVAEHQAAQWRKAQAIIDAVVQGALAVIKSLPNIFLAVAVGIASAAEVAIISAQKIPDVPPLVQYKKGGFTGEGDEEEIAGVVHKKEYIVPAKVTKMPQAEHHIAALESLRNKGYQGGGFVAPVNSSTPPQFEYDKLVSAMADAFLLLPNPQVGLVNISNGLKEVELTKSQAGLTR
jgi:hypothetical protein